MNPVGLVDSTLVLSIVKWMIVTLLVVYSIFGYLMMTQVKSMTRAIEMKDDFAVGVLAMAHFVFAILVLFIALVVL